MTDAGVELRAIELPQLPSADEKTATQAAHIKDLYRMEEMALQMRGPHGRLPTIRKTKNDITALTPEERAISAVEKLGAKMRFDVERAENARDSEGIALKVR